MYNNDQELDRKPVQNRMGPVSGGSFKRTKLQLKKSISECGDNSYEDTHHISETNFVSPVKKKTKNTVAFTQPLAQSRNTVEDFKKYNTVKASDLIINNSQYLLQQQQRIKEYSNSRNNDVSYSDTYSSSSSDYRTGIVKPNNCAVINSGATKLGTSKTSSKNSLLTRRSTQSLCSCDAETEVSQTLDEICYSESYTFVLVLIINIFKILSYFFK